MAPEFSRILDASKLLQKPHPIILQVKEEEKEPVAARLGLIALGEFKTTITVCPPHELQKLIQLDMVMEAKVTQACVASLKSVEGTIKESFSLLLSPKPEPVFSETAETALLALAQEEMETLYLNGEDFFDMGEILVQYLSLALDPYPRHPEGEVLRDGLDDQKQNPFEALKNLNPPKD